MLAAKRRKEKSLDVVSVKAPRTSKEKNGTRMGERGETEGCRGLAWGKSVCDNWHFGKIVV